MGFLDWMRRPSLADDEPVSDQADTVPALLTMAAIHLSMEGKASLKRLVESDGEQVPGAQGRFGLEPSNPIRANGPEGETVYLERLRTATGGRLFYHRVGTADCPSLPGIPVDVFEVLSANGAERAYLFLVMYNFSRSRLAPGGYSLVSWRQMSESDRTLTKLGLFGSTARVDPFPGGLPREVGLRMAKKGLPAQAVSQLVQKLEGMLAGR